MKVSMGVTDFLQSEREHILWKSIVENTWRYYLWLGLLISVIILGAYAYSIQLRQGLVVTGLRNQVPWGVYITNFVFFIGISHAGTLISSILRLTGAGWRQPVTRLAEAITVASLFVGGFIPLIDMGRPDRVANIIIHGRIQSNLVWDLIGISTYFTGSLLFFWLLMVPDVAILRDHFPNPGKVRKWLYSVLALGFRNKPGQHKILEKANHVMTVVILPLAVSVHTVVAWLFAMSLRPGWNSSIFGPYFVVGAIFSGIAAAILAMAVYRWCYGLQSYIEPLHFCNLGYLLFTMTLIYMYFNVNEYLTIGYKMTEVDRHLVEDLFTGRFSRMFWGVQTIGVIMPTLVLGFTLGVKYFRERFVIQGTVFASVGILIGAWVKRYVIIVPTLSNPFLPAQKGLPSEWINYQPTWVEWSITAAAIAAFLLIYTLISKLFPIVSIWETREAGPGPSVVETKSFDWKTGEYRPIKLILVILLALNIFRASSSEAAGIKSPEPKPTSISVSSKSSVNALSEHVMEIIAVLSDSNGVAVPDVSVKFSMKVQFGELKLGSFPTNDKGEAKVTLKDKRLGKYPLTVIFKGDDDYRAAETTVVIDFGNRPMPVLPAEGVLIGSGPALVVVLPFLAFYGSCWIVFFYCLGWLVIIKMRNCKSD